MGFIVRRCVRCDITAQLDAQSLTWNKDGLNAEIFFVCSACDQSSVYRGQPQGRLHDLHGDLDNTGRHFDRTPIFAFPRTEKLSDDIPSRVRDIFRQAAVSRKLGLNDASGAMFRKAIDVATKLIYAHDARLSSQRMRRDRASRRSGISVSLMTKSGSWLTLRSWTVTTRHTTKIRITKRRLRRWRS